MPPSRLDGLYRRMLITKFFEKGWGKPENLQRCVYQLLRVFKRLSLYYGVLINVIFLLLIIPHQAII